MTYIQGFQVNFQVKIYELLKKTMNDFFSFVAQLRNTAPDFIKRITAVNVSSYGSLKGFNLEILESVRHVS